MELILTEGGLAAFRDMQVLGYVNGARRGRNQGGKDRG
jgi:hypothetical protein